VLCLADGVYTEAIQPTTDGAAGRPITIRAINDGGATIDGGGVRVPLMLYRNWWAVEGLVLRNGAIAVARIEGDNNVLRRVSAYNADTNDNSAIIFIWGDGNLLEDVAAAGTGRYGIESYQSAGNTIRRAFVMPSGWDGRAFCGRLPSPQMKMMALLSFVSASYALTRRSTLLSPSMRATAIAPLRRTSPSTIQ
jgi:hypothetical protein